MISGERKDICIINCFFSPAGFRSPLANFNTIAAKLLETGAPMITVEAAFDNEPFQLQQQPGQTLIQLRAPARLWLKERLLNIALSHVPAEFQKVAWIDGDLLFERPEWIDEASRLLDSLEVVQLFDTIHYLPPGATRFEGISTRSHRSLLALVTDDGADSLRRMQRAIDPYAVPGGGFAARREVLAAGIYDGSVVGGNDNVFIYSVLGALDMLSIATPGLARDVRLWELAFASHRQSFTHGYVKGSVYHLWHGEREHRGYRTRHDLLRCYEYDPATDIALHENGCYCWNSPKPGLHEMTRQYFRARQEDGSATTPSPEFPAPSELSSGARVVISELYRRIGDANDQISRLKSERVALEKEVANLRVHAQNTTEWAKELKQGNSWLQSQLAHWQAHAQSHIEPSQGRTPRSLLLVVAPDQASSTTIIEALAPIPCLPVEITGITRRGAQLTFRGAFPDRTTLEHAQLMVLTLHYMSISADELERLARQLGTLTLPTVWGSIRYPLDWYCRRTMETSQSKAAPYVDPVQFVATVEEQRRRSQMLHEVLSTTYGIDIPSDGKQLLSEGRASLRLLLGLPSLHTEHDTEHGPSLTQPQNLDALLGYLERIGASNLHEEIVAPSEQPQHLLASR